MTSRSSRMSFVPSCRTLTLKGGLTRRAYGRNFTASNAGQEHWRRSAHRSRWPGAICFSGGMLAQEAAAVQEVLDGIDWLLATLDVTFGTVVIHVVNGHAAKIIPSPSYTPAELVAAVVERGVP